MGGIEKMALRQLNSAIEEQSKVKRLSSLVKKHDTPFVFPTYDIDFCLGDMEYDGAVLSKIKALYKEIPMLECKKGCTDCCGCLIPFSPAEWSRIKEKRTTSGFACPYSLEGKCDIYEQRPFLCRLFGTVDEPVLRCPYGRRPENFLTNVKWMDVMMRYFRLIQGRPVLELEEVHKVLNLFQMTINELTGVRDDK